MIQKLNINGIIFYDFDNIKFSKIIKKKGLYVFPSAPSLINMYSDKNYKKSLIYSDYVFFDSGFLCLFLFFFKGIKVKKYSGLDFLRNLISFLNKKNRKVFLIDPNKKHSIINNNYLKKNGLKYTQSYIAPKYKKKIIDNSLLKQIKKNNPEYILINLGGGVQEKVGFYLKKKLDFKPKIICTGAAIAFLTGLQANIPTFVDKIYLGWLWRILYNPSIFLLRYLNAFKLLYFLLKCNIYADK